MAGERVQRGIESFLGEAEAAIFRYDWEAVRQAAQTVLRLDPSNSDALSCLAAAEWEPGQSSGTLSQPHTPTLADQPTSFADGR